MSTINNSNCKNQIFNIEHHAGFENIFEKLVILCCTSCLYLNHNLSISTQRVCIKRFVNTILLLNGEKIGIVSFYSLLLFLVD